MKNKNKLIKYVAVGLSVLLTIATTVTSVYADENDGGFTDFSMPNLDMGGEENPGIIVGPGGENPTPFIDPVPAPVPEPTPVDPCANGHTLDGGNVVKMPSCTESGQTMYRCMICNYAEVRNEPPALGHIKDAGTIVKSATCIEDGAIVYRCVNCGADMGMDAIPKIDHVSDDGTIVTLSTCITPGLVEYKCIFCGTSLGTKEIPMIDHISDNGTIVKQPTTTTPGEIEYKCINCNTVLRKEVIPAVKKRETPNALFDTVTCTLSNIPACSTVAVNGNVITDNASGVLSLMHQFPLTGTHKITVKANATETEAESDVQTISVQKRSAPSNLSTVDEPAAGGVGYINGVSTEMEYAFADSDYFTMCTSSKLAVSAGIYIVRYKATANSIASDCIEVLVKKASHVKPATPTATLDGAAHIINSVEPGMFYSINNGMSWITASSISVKLSDADINTAAKTGHILLKRIKDKIESDVQVLPVVRNIAPKGIVTHPADGKNGKIIGVDATMQIRKSGAAKWIDIYSTQIEGVEAGKYEIRRKGINAYIESLPITVEVEKVNNEKRNKPNATYNGYNSCLSNADGCMVSFDGQVTWTSVITTNQYFVNETFVNPAFGIWLFKPATDTKLQSDKQYIDISRQSTPGGLGSVAATPTKLGKITGVDSTMQCRSALQNTWTDITSYEVVLPAGIYYVRRKGFNQSLPSESVQVTINAVPDGTPASTTTVIESQSTSSSSTIVVERTSTSDKPSSSSEKKEQTIIVEHNEIKKEETVNTENENKSEATIIAEELIAEQTEEEDVVDVVKEEATTLTGEKGWEAIEATFEVSTMPVVVELNLETEVPATVFEKAAATSTPLVFEANKDAVWSIEPADINVSEVVKPVNLGIDNDSTVIPKQVIEEVDNNPTDQKVDRTFDIKHEGSFGFKANLTIKAKNPSQGKYANLYWYKPDTGKLTFVDFARVNEMNEATFTMTHASSYAVIISDKIMSDASLEAANNQTVTTDTQQATETVNNTGTAVKTNKIATSTILFVILAILILSVLTGVAIVIYNKMS